VEIATPVAPSLRDLNSKNAAFWAELKALGRDGALHTTAAEVLLDEARRKVPFEALKPFAEALRDAQRVRQRFASQLGRSGGKSKRGDSLQELIVELVRPEPEMSVVLLLRRLHDHVRGKIIEEIT